MTSMQRLGAVLSGDKPDRPPYGLVCASMGAGLNSCALDDYYREPKLYAKGQAALCDILDPDIIFSPFLFAYEAAAFGAELAPQARSVPNVAKPPYRSIEEALNAPMPSLRDDSYLRFLIEAAQVTVELARGERIVVAPITAPIDLPALLIGIEAWLEALLFKPEEAALLNARATEHFVALGSARPTWPPAPPCWPARSCSPIPLYWTPQAFNALPCLPCARLSRACRAP